MSTPNYLGMLKNALLREPDENLEDFVKTILESLLNLKKVGEYDGKINVPVGPSNVSNISTQSIKACFADLLKYPV